MALISTSGFKIGESAAPFNFRVREDECIGITGPADVEPAKLLQFVDSKAGKSVRTHWVEPTALPGRTTLQNLAKANGPDRAAQVLTLLRLWDVRRLTISALSERQRRAAAWVPPLVEPTELILSDESLDHLDPWVLTPVLAALKEMKAAKLLVSFRPDVLEQCDRILVLNDRGLRFDGSPMDLIRIIRPAQVVVETENPGAISALVEPLQLQITASPGQMTIHTTEGQKLAADLCAQGYPYIRAISVRTPTLAEALQALIR